MKPGDNLEGKYAILGSLGSGSSSNVFRGISLDGRDRPIAVKLLKERLDNPQYKEAFDREVLALKTIEHDNIVTIYDTGTTDEGLPYLVTELCTDQLQPMTNPRDDAAVKLTLVLLSALQQAHAVGVIHRDLKPQHILSVEVDGAKVPKVIDFGIAKIRRYIGTGLTLAGAFSPGYACEDQIRGAEAKPYFDLYSVAACVYWYVTGTDPAQDRPLKELIQNSTPKLQRTSFRQFLVRLADARDLGLTAGPAFRELERLSEKWVPARDTHLVVPADIFKRIAKLTDTPADDVTAVVQAIQADLGAAQERYPVLAVQAGAVDPEAWFGYRYRLIGRSYLWRLSPHSTARCFVVTDVVEPDTADMEGQRIGGLEAPANWITLPPSAPTPGDAQSIRELCQEVIADEKERQRRKSEGGKRETLVDVWETVFKIRKANLSEAGQYATYRSWSQRDGLLQVETSGASHAGPNWLDGARLSMSRSMGEGYNSAGVLVAIHGSTLVLKPHETAKLDFVAQAGRIGPDRSQDYAAIRRQSDALTAIRQGRAYNPDLPNVLCGAKLPEPIGEVAVDSWYYTDLDEAKRVAVQKALGAEDLLLIQGPPGTGKTLAIAELVLQIVARRPHDRILLTSQSHVAVDQAIERIRAKAPNVSLLRLARDEERVSASIKSSLPREQAQFWRERVLSRSRDYLSNLGIDPGAARGTASVRDLLGEVERLDSQIKAMHTESMAVRSKLAQFSRKGQTGPEDDEAEIREELGLLDEEVHSLRQDREAAEQLAREFFSARGIEVEGEPSTWAEHIPVVEAFDSLTPGQHALLGVWDKWRRQFGKGMPYEAALAKRARILSGTCLGVASHPAVDRGEFEWVIIDEAGRATPPELLVPLIRGRRAILVGDHKQLPPIVDREISEQDLSAEGLTRAELEISLFERLYHELPETHRVVLDRQYRMHPSIAALVSDVFYEGLLKNGETTRLVLPELIWPEKAVTWFTTSNDLDRAELSEGTSFRNEREVRVIRQVLERLLAQFGAHSTIGPTVGVIAGYEAQKVALARAIDVADPRWQPMQIEVNTVDAFQGRERDVMLYSAVRSNVNAEIGFLSDVRRLNVALSRSRMCLVIVGDHRMLRLAHGPTGYNPFRGVIDWIRTHSDAAEITETVR